LFIDGEDYVVSDNFAYCLCNNRELDLQEIAESCEEDELQMLVDLYNSGKLYTIL